MTETIEAIYENGVFRPVSEVSLPDGLRVRVEADSRAAVQLPSVNTGNDLDEQIRRRLRSEGATVEDETKILENLHLLWDSFDGLSESELSAIEQAKLDQQNFFAR